MRAPKYNRLGGGVLRVQFPGSKKRVHKGSLLGSPRTNVTLGVIHAIFVTAQRRKLAPGNPVAYVEKQRERKSEVDPLSLEEVRALLSTANGQEHVIFTRLIFAGLRPTNFSYCDVRTSISIAA